MVRYRSGKALRKLLIYKPMKTMILTQFLVPISIFSVVFSYTFHLPSPLVYGTPIHFHYFSADYFRFLSHALDKNVVFIIFNVLLVFLAKTSGLGLVHSPCYSSKFDVHEMLHERIDEGLQIALDKSSEDKSTVMDESDIVMEKSDEPIEGGGEEEERVEDEETKEVVLVECVDERPREALSTIVAESDCGDECDSQKLLAFDDDDDDDEEQYYGKEGDEEEEEEELYGEGEDNDLSTEELNEKFEEFIRRMKEGFRITPETPHQLPLEVN